MPDILQIQTPCKAKKTMCKSVLFSVALLVVGCSVEPVDFYGPTEFVEATYSAPGEFAKETAILKDELSNAFDTQFAYALDTDDSDKLVVAKLPASIDFVVQVSEKRGSPVSEARVPQSEIAVAPKWWSDFSESEYSGPFDWVSFESPYHSGMRVWVDDAKSEEGYCIVRIWVWQRQWSVE